MHGAFGMATKPPRPLTPASFSSGERWYCVHTARRSEIAAELEIRALGLQPYLPKEVRWNRHQKNRRHKIFDKVARPLIPRYLFVPIDGSVLPEARHAIESLRSVEEMICYRDGFGIPARIPTGAIVDMRAREAAGEFDQTLARDEACPYGHGQTVRVRDGVFIGLSVQFRKMKPNRRAELWMSILGAMVPVELPLAYLEKL